MNKLSYCAFAAQLAPKPLSCVANCRLNQALPTCKCTLVKLLIQNTAKGTDIYQDERCFMSGNSIFNSYKQISDNGTPLEQFLISVINSFSVKEEYFPMTFSMSKTTKIIHCVVKITYYYHDVISNLASSS